LRKRLRKILSEFLSPAELDYVYSSYEIVGDIAIIKLTDKSQKHGKAIADAIMKAHRNVKTVLAQASAVRGDLRLRELKHITGEDKAVTIHRESKCLFLVDIKKCYFSPRLLYERMRIAEQVKSGEVVVNMFAGVGCFSIIIAKHADVEKIHSIDVNPSAVAFMKENVRLNRLYGKVIPILGEAKETIEQKLCHVADRVLMPLPEKALEYLPSALLALKKTGGWIHYYDFEHATKDEDPIEKAKPKITEKLANLNVAFNIAYGRVVRTTGPNWYQIALDIKIDPIRSL